MVQLLAFKKHLQTRTSTDCVIGKSRDDTASVGVVLHFISRSCSKYAPYCRISLSVRREKLRRRPVTGIVFRRLRRIESRSYPVWNKLQYPLNGLLLSKPLHRIAPPDAIFVILKEQRRLRVAFLEARNFATSIKSPTE